MIIMMLVQNLSKKTKQKKNKNRKMGSNNDVSGNLTRKESHGRSSCHDLGCN